MITLHMTILFHLVLQVSSDSSICRSTEGDQKNGPTAWKTLLDPEYSAQRAPSFGEPGADSVSVAIQILDIDEVNENQMIQTFVITAWSDARLAVENIRGFSEKMPRILLPDDAFHCFWSPSLIFDNNKDGKHFSLSVPNTLMAVYRNKTVLKASRFSVKVRCRFDLSRYPMDVQKCQFRMRLFDESADMVQLKWINQGNFTWITNEDVRMNPNIKPTQFKISLSDPWQITKRWLNNNYTHVGVNITFTRLLTSSLLTIYIPSTLIVSLSWISFWIDVQGIPGRVSLGIMSILTIITQILDIRKNMPPVSYVTAIDIWLFVCLISVFLSLVEYAFAYNYIRKKTTEQLKKRDAEAGTTGNPDDQRSVTTVINGVSRIAWTPLASVVKPPESSARPNRVLKTVLSSLRLNQINVMQFSISQLDDNSKIGFPVLFSMFALTYWIYYTCSEGGGGGVDEY